MSADAPSLQAIRSLRVSLGDAVYRTPVTRCAALEPGAGGPSTIWGKLEFLQVTGTFKARGALSNLKTLDSGQLAAGVTAVSAGNHAIATAYAARAVGTTAKVIMLGSANPCRIELCKAYGAEVLVVDDVHEAFDVAEQVEREEGRFFVHPFEGPAVAAGTGMIGLEICEQVEAFDALIVPIGGGGLMGGISNAVKQLRPDVEIIGVEPIGANSMHLSFDAGEPRSIDKVRTIADSLGAPYALPYSFELCRRNVDRLVEVDDTQLRMAMGVLFRKMKIAVEPACAATTAAMLGPLHGDLRDKRVVLVFCGSNIDWETYSREVLFDE
jgi:threonine dehydratase